MRIASSTAFGVRVSASLAAMVFAGSAASGVLISWDNPGVGDWYDPANWDCGVPAAGEVLWMENGGTAVVSGGVSPVYSIILCREAGLMFTGGVFNSNSIRFGQSGTAFGEINGASTVINCNDMTVSEGAIASVCFNHVDGTVNVNGEMSVAFDGDGAYFHDAGTVNADEINLGFFSGSNGQYSFFGGEINLVDLFVGVDGTGSFFQHGGVLNITEDMRVPISSGSGKFRLIDGELNVDRVIRSSSETSSEFRMLGGEFNVREFGQGALPIDLKTEGGTFTPGGPAIGMSTICGSLDQQAGSSIRMDIDSSASSDLVEVEDEVILAGDLVLDLDYAPLGMEMFVVINNLGPNPVFGTFTDQPEGSSITATFGGSTYNFAVTYTGGDGNDVVIGACFGDATGDGVIDFDDLNAVLSNWGEPGPEGDLNGSGLVDFDDLNLVLSAWEMDCI